MYTSCCPKIMLHSQAAQPRTDVTVREVSKGNIDDLHQMILRSTGGLTKLTAQGLLKDFCSVQTEFSEVENNDKVIEFDATLLKSDKPVAQAHIAYIGEEPVGYIVFHYHYSPWTSHCIYIDDIFAKHEYRRQGIAKILFQSLADNCAKKNLKLVVFSVNRGAQILTKLIQSDSNTEWIRNDDTEWSVCRIYFRRKLV